MGRCSAASPSPACRLDLVLYAFPPANTSHLPKRIVALDYLLLLAFVAGTRLLARSLDRAAAAAGSSRAARKCSSSAPATPASCSCARCSATGCSRYTPIGFVDDDPRKENLRIHGVRVLGTTDELGHLIRDHRPDEVLIAMPSAPGELRRKIVETARARGDRR